MFYKKFFFSLCMIFTLCAFHNVACAAEIGGGGTVPGGGGVVIPDLPDGCTPGTYAEGNGFSSCPEGYYCPGNPCEKRPCPHGKVAQTIGQSQCFSCPSGQGANPGHTACVPECEGHFYMNNGQCTQCPDDAYYANENHTGCSACNSGPYYATTEDVCMRCTGSTPYANENHNGCVACNGVGQTVVDGVCVSCSGDTPYMNPNGNGCTDCQGINEWLDSHNVCRSCSGTMQNFYTNTVNADLYKLVHIDGNTGRTACGLQLKFGGNGSKCKNNSVVQWHVTSETENAAWVLSDNPVVHATTTSYIVSSQPTAPDTDWCEMCQSGTFNMNDGVGAEACSACPSRYCLNNNQCQTCPAGHYCDTENLSCSNAPVCPKGSFSGTRQASCSTCAAGYTTNGEGTTWASGETVPCFLAPINLKYANGNIVSFPDFITRGRLNTSVLHRR